MAFFKDGSSKRRINSVVILVLLNDRQRDAVCDYNLKRVDDNA